MNYPHIENPHIIDALTGEQVPVRIIQLSTDRAVTRYNKKNGWHFQWVKEFYDGYDIYAVQLAASPYTIQGLLALKPDPDSVAVEMKLVGIGPNNYKRVGQYYKGIGRLLFAKACEMSFEYEFEGYVYLVAKTNLIGYYREAFHAELIGVDRKMLIDTDAAIFILENYA